MKIVIFRICFYVPLALASFNILKMAGLAEFSTITNVSPCLVVDQKILEPGDVQAFVDCLKSKNNFFQRLVLRPDRYLNALKFPVNYLLVGKWKVQRKELNFEIEFTLNGAFKIEPRSSFATQIGSAFEGLWRSPSSNQLIWMTKETLWPFKVNDLKWIDNSRLTFQDKTDDEPYILTRLTPALSQRAIDTLTSFKKKRVPEFFIDVWDLRRDVIKTEALFATDNYDGCTGKEGEAEEDTRTPEEIERENKIEEKCVALSTEKYTQYTSALSRFNAKWQPLLLKAIESGDPVAEVIMRQCSTTDVINRSKIESTCDNDESRKAVAAIRLREINFAPAFDWASENAPYRNFNADNKIFKKASNYLLEQFKYGIFGYCGSDVRAYETENSSDDELKRLTRIIGGVLQVAPRAFTFPDGKNVNGNLSTIRLNRQPVTPVKLTWGPRFYVNSNLLEFAGLNTFWYGLNNMHNNIRKIPRGFQTSIDNVLDLVVTTESTIDRYLKDDPRWAVFLLNRVGHHEWDPVGVKSKTSSIKKELLGKWEITKTFEDWKLIENYDTPLSAETVKIYKDGEVTKIDFYAKKMVTPPLENGLGCILRYSGASTFLPEITSHANSQSWQQSMLGLLKERSDQVEPDTINAAAFAPFDPKKVYEQILVLCPEGESTNTQQLRFLLLAEGALVEVAARSPNTQRPFADFKTDPIYIRHYKHVKEN